MRRGAVAVVAAVLLLAVAASGAALVLGYQRVGRTPAEIIGYLQRRLEGHPKLQAVALPALAAVGPWLGTAPTNQPELPFVVPPLAPNPALQHPADVAAWAAPAPPGVLRVGMGQAVTTIAEAARRARDGDTVEIAPGDYVADVAVWMQKRLTIRGMGERVRLIAAGASAEGKAIWVIRRGDFRVENIEFHGARVADRNGAGIRHEGGNLVLRNCVFNGNEDGVVTGGDAASTLTIENSEFGYNGAGDGQSHDLYVGRIASLSVTGSWFHHANVGHLIKSRAAGNVIRANRIADGSGGRASYELEFPNGGDAEVVGNLIVQGFDTRNSVIVSYGAEGYVWPSNRFAFTFNTVVNDQTHGGTFVRVAAGPVRVFLRNNLYVGTGLRLSADGVADVDRAGDLDADWRDFLRPARGDYRPSGSARQRFGPLAPTPAALLPRTEFVAPRSRQALAGTPRFPGAFQGPE